MAKAVSYLEQNLHAHGYDCILGCSGFKQEEKVDYVRLLLSKKIDTLILVGSTYAGNGKDESDTDYITLAKEMIAVGVQYFIVTDIAKDGTLSGVNLKQLKDLRDATTAIATSLPAAVCIQLKTFAVVRNLDCMARSAASRSIKAHWI